MQLGGKTRPLKKMSENAISGIFCLEEDFYKEGLRLGYIDGEKAGRLEGRAVGVEKGFEKFVNIGKMHGRSIIWGAMLSDDRSRIRLSKFGKNSILCPNQPPAKGSRLLRNLETLHDLTKLNELPLENTENAVSTIEDTRRRADSKAKMIEKAFREGNRRFINNNGRKANFLGQNFFE